ncbi:hypothetical protein ABBQ32_007602 [Trebouxia sp. C0010 RCD-2024]
MLRCGDVLRANMHPDRAPADKREGLSVFRLTYSDEGATRLLVDDIWPPTCSGVLNEAGTLPASACSLRRDVIPSVGHFCPKYSTVFSRKANFGGHRRTAARTALMNPLRVHTSIKGPFSCNTFEEHLILRRALGMSDVRSCEDSISSKAQS